MAGRRNPAIFSTAIIPRRTASARRCPQYPFLDQGDTVTVIYRQRCEQALTSYTPLDLKSAMPGVAGAYPFRRCELPGTAVAGIVEFDRLFGNIPKQRIVRGKSFKYPFQYVLSSGAKISGAGTDDLSYEGPTYSIGTEPTTVDSILIMDYFLDGQQAQFPLLHAPKLELIGQNIDPVGGRFCWRSLSAHVVGRLHRGR